MQIVIKKLGTPVVASLTLILGFCLTAVLCLGTARFEDEALSADFNQRVTSQVSLLQESLEEAVQILTIVNRLFVTVGQPSRQQFALFTAPLLRKYPYVHAFAFQRLVKPSERDAFEATMRHLFPNFRITTFVAGALLPTALRSRYLVVDYLQALQSEEITTGLDMASYPEVREALQRALKNWKAVSTVAFQVTRSNEGQRSLLVLMPVYQYGAATMTIEQRQLALSGSTSIIFRVNDVLQKILNASVLPKGANVSVYMSGADRSYELVFHHDSSSSSQPLSWMMKLAALLYRPPIDLEKNFELAGQEWYLDVDSGPLSLPDGHERSLFIAAIGILLSILASSYLTVLSMRSRRVQLVVEEKTAALQLTHALLTEDIHARKLTEQALKLRQRAIDASAHAIIILNATAPEYLIEYVNPAFERITGHSAADAIGQGICLLTEFDRDHENFVRISAALDKQSASNVVLCSYRKDGILFWGDLYVAPLMSESGQMTHFVAALYDITSMKRYEAELEFQASRDTLTGLLNRSMLRDSLERAMFQAQRCQYGLWVVYVDLDRFKFVNDTLGHKAGDLLLQKIATRLRSAVPDTDTVARLGGDEFVMTLSERANGVLDHASLQKIMDTVATPLTIEGHTFYPTCSLGVATFPEHGDEPEMLIKYADIAMFRAKENGRNNYQFYTDSMNKQALERLRIEGDLRNALQRDEFFLHYQPKIDLRSGRIVGMEALIRWRHPELGMVSPARFISLAEDTGLILPIGAWVIRTACAQAKIWDQAGFTDLRVSVNLSVRQFVQKDLVSSIAEMLMETGLVASHLEIELTESLVMTDVELAIGILRELKDLGVHLSIDDFGTGYSSLSYLKRFPIDILKIDQSFVRDITVDTDDAAITVSIISLAHNLKLEVIAEGVETQEQLAYLRHHGCDVMQGHFFSPAVSARQFEMLLRQATQLPAQLELIADI